MMNDNFKGAADAAEIIWTCWQNGQRIDALPDDLRPQSRSDGYAAQSALAGYSDRPLFGWKIAATSEAGQQHIGVSGPLAGRLLPERVFTPDQELTFGANYMAVAEPEFAFRMGADLAPRAEDYSQAEVMAAVGALHLAIELPDSRFADFATAGEAQLLADNACAHEFVLGPEVTTDWRAVDLSGHPVIISNNQGVVHEGVGANVLGDPRIALTWLVNELSALGISLHEGMVVTTGTCAIPFPIGAGDRVTADFGAFGQFTIQFKEQKGGRYDRTL